MKVLHILDHSVPLFSGYSFRSRSIIHAQRDLGLAPVVLTSPKQGSAAEAVEEIEGIRYYRTPSISRGVLRYPFVRELTQMAGMRRRIEEVARKERVQILHSHSPLLNGLPALRVARRLHCPLVYEARAFWEDAAVDHGTFAAGSLRYRISRSLETFLFKRTDRVVTICEAMRGELGQRGVTLDRIEVVPNGVNIAEFKPMERSAELANRLGLNGGPVFGFIGSFYRYEGLRFFLEAFPKIRAQIPAARLILVGGGEEDDVLRDLAQRQPGVVFTGRVPHRDVNDYYSVIDVFVCPRLRMRLTELVTPLKPLESMAMGKAVLASDVGGHKELIDNGRTGRLFTAESVDDLVAQSVQLAMDPAACAKLGESGRKFVAEERSWGTLAEKYVRLYEGALRAKASESALRA